MALKTSLLFLVVFVVRLTDSAETSPADVAWELWKEKYNKVYRTTNEEGLRKATWLDHYKLYTEHTAKPDRQFEMEMNEFSDLILPRSKLSTVANEEVASGGWSPVRFAPESWDWRDHGAVTPVINQGMVNDVLSIVVTECVESYTAIQGGKLVPMSYAECKQCCVPQPILSEHVFSCIHNIGGLCSASSYPIQSDCRNVTCIPVGTINGGKKSPQGNEVALMETVATMPVLAGIDASRTSFQMYKSGVYADPKCSDIRIDHVVQIIGYGSMDRQDFWICKNSWGTNWGMDGYILIARNHDNMCGIASEAFYPV